MNNIDHKIESILSKWHQADVQIQTLGRFKVKVQGAYVDQKSFGRDATAQLFQFLITARHRNGLHKEQIIDRIWYDLDGKSGLQNFKVAHHGINKALEPNRAKGKDPQYLIRDGAIYYLANDKICVDIDIMEQLIAGANEVYNTHPDQSIQAYHEALDFDHGIYLPNRLYDDWSSEERERIQLLILNAYISLSELSLTNHPAESIRLTQKVLLIDNTWEDAYRIQMKAYLANGNRPMAIKTYQNCVKVLNQEYGIEPLPATKNLLKEIQEK